METEKMGGRFTLPGTPWSVRRVGYGAMQLAGKGVFGPPKDRGEALAVLREAIEQGVDHIDTSDFYGPHVVNELIREALHPYRDDLLIVTKVGCIRGADGSWPASYSRAQLTQQVHDNLRNLGLDRLQVVNLRARADMGPFEPALMALVDLKREGLIEHIGLSGVTSAHVNMAQRQTPIVCVQNEYNLANRGDDALVDELAAKGIAYVPFFPLGGFDPLRSEELSAIAGELGTSPLQLAQAWLLRRSPNILLIPGTSSVGHLRENLAAADIDIPSHVLGRLEAIAGYGGGAGPRTLPTERH